MVNFELLMQGGDAKHSIFNDVISPQYSTASIYMTAHVQCNAPKMTASFPVDGAI